jgi:hypothetical protein
MRSLRILNRRAGSIIAAATMVFATMVPGLVSAATVTSRSIALSNSTKAVTGVTYHVVFTSPSSTKDFVLDFCSTAALNTTCTPPVGLDVTTATTATSGYSVADIGANTTAVTKTSAGTSIDMELTGVTNPSAAGVFYARITTYAAAHDYTDATHLGTSVDDGSVAMSATDGFGVSGRALETLTFCAARSDDTISTGCTGTLHSPSITLGTGGIIGTALETGVVKTQISTNATGGAVVSLKNSATGCGGLVRQGADTNAHGCGIAPLTSAGAIGSGAAKFGLKLGNLGGASSTTTKAFGSYNTTNYYMGYVSGDASGVTGPYGDPIYKTSVNGTDDGPVSDGTADLTFGANISAITPAGSYSAALNLIATGTF